MKRHVLYTLLFKTARVLVMHAKPLDPLIRNHPLRDAMQSLGRLQEHTRFSGSPPTSEDSRNMGTLSHLEGTTPSDCTASATHTETHIKTEDKMETFDEMLTIEDVIADLAAKQAWLSSHIDSHLDELNPMLLARLLTLHGQNASRLGRLLRDQRTLSGEAADGIAGAIERALDELSITLGTQL